jgi:hypothetical protein
MDKVAWQLIPPKVEMYGIYMRWANWKHSDYQPINPTLMHRNPGESA